VRIRLFFVLFHASSPRNPFISVYPYCFFMENCSYQENNADWVICSAEDTNEAFLFQTVFHRFVFRGCSMLRMGFGLAALFVLISSVGCQMCCHPYLQCGPVYSGNHCQSCCTNSREGSVLDGSTQLPATTDLAKASGTTEKAKLGIVAGSEKIISVKDRVVEHSPSKSAEPPQLSLESVRESTKPLPANGWTARRQVSSEPR
jgi:hypothetical protein